MRLNTLDPCDLIFVPCNCRPASRDEPRPEEHQAADATHPRDVNATHLSAPPRKPLSGHGPPGCLPTEATSSHGLFDLRITETSQTYDKIAGSPARLVSPVPRGPTVPNSAPLLTARSWSIRL
ncbi:hypothetical protein VTN02DRAFT_144 [Thermoascus thermophilus]